MAEDYSRYTRVFANQRFGIATLDRTAGEVFEGEFFGDTNRDCVDDVFAFYSKPVVLVRANGERVDIPAWTQSGPGVVPGPLTVEIPEDCTQFCIHPRRRPNWTRIIRGVLRRIPAGESRDIPVQEGDFLYLAVGNTTTATAGDVVRMNSAQTITVEAAAPGAVIVRIRLIPAPKGLPADFGTPAWRRRVRRAISRIRARTGETAAEIKARLKAQYGL